MQSSNKIKLTTDAIYFSLLSLALVFISAKLLVDDSKVVDGVGFETDFEHKVYLIVSIGFLIYVLTRPIIYFDDDNLYIKRIYKKRETIVPLKNITSIFKNPFGSRGTNMITIEYINNSNESSSIKFTTSYFSERLKNLINHTQQRNPHVEIV